MRNCWSLSLKLTAQGPLRLSRGKVEQREFGGVVPLTWAQSSPCLERRTLCHLWTPQEHYGIHVKTGSGHESLSTCDFLSIHHFQDLCLAESWFQSRLDNRGIQTQSDVMEPPTTWDKSSCVEFYLSLKQLWLQTMKLAAISPQPPYCLIHTEETVCLDLPGSCVERQVMMGVSSQAKSPFASARAAASRPWLDRAPRLNGCLSSYQPKVWWVRGKAEAHSETAYSPPTCLRSICVCGLHGANSVDEWMWQ